MCIKNCGNAGSEEAATSTWDIYSALTERNSMVQQAKE